MNDKKEEIRFKIKNSHYFKFGGIAPEGFIMLPEETLDRLKDFDYWKQWVSDNSILERDAIEDTKKL